MFPLGSAILPGSVLPLHIFEPRYIQLLLDVQAGDGTFGTALITRGREAGTDVDQSRENVGTLVRVVESQRLPEHPDELRFMVVAVAESRLRIHEWLPDAPYPRAMVTAAPEPVADASHQTAYGDALTLLADVMNLREALGEQMNEPLKEVSADAALASFQIAMLAGIGPLDAAALLAEDDLHARLARVNSALHDLLEALKFRTGG
jgi:Lon protease-like protein